MQLKELRNHCLQLLCQDYDKAEVHSFFYILVEHILKPKKVEVALQLNRIISKTEIQQFEDAISKLLEQQPIQYIIGETEFYGLKFKVNENVLIPRPETEELVDWIIEDVKDKSFSILDIGTGSGCIAVSLANHLSNSTISALDVSGKALEIAKVNANLNLAEVNFIQADVLNCAEELPAIYDIIVSNPPYVRVLEKDQMKANVLEYEPHLALFVPNDDALVFYKKIIELAKNSLSSKGVLYFEINEYLSQDMLKLIKNSGFETVELKQDVFGKDRMIRAKRKHR